MGPPEIDDEPGGDRRLAGELLARARRQAGLSQAELARRCKVPAPVVNAIERGKRQPSVATLAKLVRGAGVRLRLDLGGTSDEPGSLLPELLLSRETGIEAGPADLARARRAYTALDFADSIRNAKGLDRQRGLR